MRRLDIDGRGCPRAEHGQLARARNGTRPEAPRGTTAPLRGRAPNRYHPRQRNRADA